MTTATLSINHFNNQLFHSDTWSPSSPEDNFESMSFNQKPNQRDGSNEPDLNAWELEFDQFNMVSQTPYDYNLQLPNSFITHPQNFTSSVFQPQPFPHDQINSSFSYPSHVSFMSPQQIHQMAEIQRSRYTSSTSSSSYNPFWSNTSPSSASFPSIKEEYPSSSGSFIPPQPNQLNPNYKTPVYDFKTDPKYLSVTSSTTDTNNHPTSPPSTLQAIWPLSPTANHSSMSLPLSNTNRLCWTKELHQMFEESIERLGKAATAKNVMLMMISKGADPECLTRIRVANHLQYYNTRNKKKQQAISSKKSQEKEEKVAQENRVEGPSSSSEKPSRS
eukprot:TRINITY_DN648_c0_g1_i1.p1 TRINITY_DN648_c0_g1~~TRINITY_DN648_c0_g1_i1.p1  ORF type:complete len:332 (+),score=70.31 TRINITY_DN648_c0_g1_i1:573-1568(+)